MMELKKKSATCFVEELKENKKGRRLFSQFHHFHLQNHPNVSERLWAGCYLAFSRSGPTTTHQQSVCNAIISNICGTIWQPGNQW